MKVNCKVNTKANPIKETKYIIKAFDNEKEPVEEQAYVMVKHFTNKSLNKHINLISQSLDPCEIFMDQVVSVHNVYNTFTDTYMTKEEIVESEANKMTMAIINEVFAYLLGETKLNKEEEKN